MFKSTLLKTNLWHLDKIVTGTFSVSVVAKIKTTSRGGSSSVLRSALKAAFDNMWTSSIIKIFFLALTGL